MDKVEKILIISIITLMIIFLIITYIFNILDKSSNNLLFILILFVAGTGSIFLDRYIIDKLLPIPIISNSDNKNKKSFLKSKTFGNIFAIFIIVVGLISFLMSPYGGLYIVTIPFYVFGNNVICQLKDGEMIRHEGYFDGNCYLKSSDYAKSCNKNSDCKGSCAIKNRDQVVEAYDKNSKEFESGDIKIKDFEEKTKLKIVSKCSKYINTKICSPRIEDDRIIISNQNFPNCVSE